MSGISVSEDAVNLFYLMKAKSAVGVGSWKGLTLGRSAPSCRTAGLSLGFRGVLPGV